MQPGIPSATPSHCSQGALRPIPATSPIPLIDSVFPCPKYGYSTRSKACCSVTVTALLAPIADPSASLGVGIVQDGGSDEVVFSVHADLVGAGGEATSSGCPG